MFWVFKTKHITAIEHHETNHNAARKRETRWITRTRRRKNLRQHVKPPKLQSLSDCIFRSPPITWADTRSTRRMRSESLSFSEICNSRCVTQFAASFNDPRAKAFVVARDRKHYKRCNELATSSRRTESIIISGVSIWRVACGIEHCANDPSAGSPTETLLRLLLPLDDKAYWTFCDNFAPAKIFISPINSPDHPIGRSDGRCVQRAGTYSARVDDSRLQGIPRSRCTIAIIYP